MSIAYTLINSETGYEAEVIEELKKLPGVQEIYQLYGVYDIIIKLEAESLEELKETMLFRVRKLERVKTTLTLICI